ncbi:DUF917 domain-containing protein, partial [[Eubacterium] cellulosolvens]
GGGGAYHSGLGIIEKAYSEGLNFRLASIEELSNKSLTFTFYLFGSTFGVHTQECGGYRGDCALRTLRSFEEIYKKRADAINPYELGGINLPVPLDLSARAEIPLIDGDHAGRATPTVWLSQFVVKDFPMTPHAYTDENDQYLVLVEKWKGPKFFDVIAFSMMREFGLGYGIGSPLTKEQAHNILIPGTVTRCIEVGKAIRVAKKEGKNTFDAAIESTGGFKLFQGIIEKIEKPSGKTPMAYLEVIIHGDNSYKNRIMKIKARNENLIAYIDEKPVCVVPDLATPFDLDDERATTTEALKPGQKIGILGIPAHKRWRNPKGIEMWTEVRKDVSSLEIYTPIETLASL